MDSNKKFFVEVAFAGVKEQRIFKVEVLAGSTVREAIEGSGVLEAFPEIDLEKQKVGVFSKARKLTDLVKAGDRVEIYRELAIDPKEARRKRHKKVK
jgi:putative ubiquitin-RnfH superfamily antitoxin RatB of RatAB toxin-antitoxin module